MIPTLQYRIPTLCPAEYPAHSHGLRVDVNLYEEARDDTTIDAPSSFSAVMAARTNGPGLLALAQEVGVMEAEACREPPPPLPAS